MLKQPGVDIVSSFAMWMDHMLLHKGQAFTNWSGLFYRQSGTKVNQTSFNTFASPFREFVHDTSVSGAIVPSGVYINNVFTSTGTSGLKLDYVNGRVWTAPLAGNPTISGNYSVKEYNIYCTNQSEDYLLFENKYQFKPKFTQIVTGLRDDVTVAPCIFITNPEGHNSAEQLGGETWKKELNIRAVVFAETDMDLLNVASFFQDYSYTAFPMINDTPLNFYNDFKGGQRFNYINQAQNKPLAFIENVYFTRFTPAAENSVNIDAKVGFLEFEVYYSRAIDRSIS